MLSVPSISGLSPFRWVVDFLGQQQAIARASAWSLLRRRWGYRLFVSCMISSITSHTILIMLGIQGGTQDRSVTFALSLATRSGLFALLFLALLRAPALFTHSLPENQVRALLDTAHRRGHVVTWDKLSSSLERRIFLSTTTLSTFIPVLLGCCLSPTLSLSLQLLAQGAWLTFLAGTAGLLLTEILLQLRRMGPRLARTIWWTMLLLPEALHTFSPSTPTLRLAAQSWLSFPLGF